MLLRLFLLNKILEFWRVSMASKIAYNFTRTYIQLVKDKNHQGEERSKERVVEERSALLSMSYIKCKCSTLKHSRKSSNSTARHLSHKTLLSNLLSHPTLHILNVPRVKNTLEYTALAAHMRREGNWAIPSWKRSLLGHGQLHGEEDFSNG